MRIFVVLGVLFMMVNALTLSAQEPVITLVDQQTMDEFFSSDVRDVSLSPDGNWLASDGNNEICVVEIETQTENCYEKPEGIGRIGGSALHNAFAWSFDSRFVTFTANFYQNLREPDIWVFDVQTGEYRNLTDDGITRVMGEGSEGALLDYMPTFAPNGDIYFFRTISVDGLYLTNLYRLTGDYETPEFVSDLTAALPRLSVYYYSRVSPDGAFLVYPVLGTRIDDPQNGLWLIDLESGDSEQIAGLSDALLGMPPEDSLYIFDNPIWMPNSSGVFVSTSSTSAIPSKPNQNYLYIDLEGEITPLVDMSDFPEGSAALAEDEDGNTALLLQPRAGALLPDGSGFVYLRYNMGSREGQLVWMPLPPNGEDARLIAEIEFEVPPFVPNMMMGGRRALIMGTLYTFDIGE